MKLSLLRLALLASACTKGSPAPAAPAPARTVTPVTGPTPVTYVTQPAGGNAAPAPPNKDQPPHLKLKVGHYTDGTIGVVIDLASAATDNVADIDPAKIRFDGDSKIYLLQGQHGARGRIDYVTDGGRVMLHVWDNGRRSVYVPDPETDRFSEELRLRRDADADPL